MPDDFTNRIHQALRSFWAGDNKDTLADLLLAQKIRAKQDAATPRLISNQILQDGLDLLRQTNKEGADLLQWRFLDRETAQEIAYRLNVTENIIFQRQRTAIKQLALIIWDQEQELRQQRAQRIEARLEPPTYNRLFGVTEKKAEVRVQLENNSAPWLIALEGLGGIGKTSLADALVRELAWEGPFNEIGWVSARRRLFRSGEIEMLTDQPALTLGELVDRLVDQFELLGLRRQSDAEKLMGLKDFLKNQTCLIVVDNLETAADYRSLVSQLQGLANPSKFLLTTRYGLHDLGGVYGLPLKHLSPDDTVALVRYESEIRHLPELVKAPETELRPIYDITGGNPLAIKLIIGQIHTLSLQTALALFKAAKGKSVEELLAYIYAKAWQDLDSASRQVLQAMLLVTEEGGRLEQIAAAAEFDEADTATCLQRLVILSLVNVSGDLNERRYSLHQLTQTFLAQQSSDNSF
jgi:DNA polymerase III delta prime subunit